MLNAPDITLAKAMFVAETVSALKHGGFILSAITSPNIRASTAQMLLIRTREMPENVFCFPPSARG